MHPICKFICETRKTHRLLTFYMVHHPNRLPRWFQFYRIQVVSIACPFMLILTDYWCISTVPSTWSWSLIKSCCLRDIHLFFFFSMMVTYAIFSKAVEPPEPSNLLGGTIVTNHHLYYLLPLVGNTRNTLFSTKTSTANFKTRKNYTGPFCI